MAAPIFDIGIPAISRARGRLLLALLTQIRMAVGDSEKVSKALVAEVLQGDEDERMKDSDSRRSKPQK